MADEQELKTHTPRGEMANYGPEGRYSGYIVRPEGNGPFPGMVVIHEWWGLNNWIKLQADKLADAGYVALAVDLFGRVVDDADEARKNVQNLDQQAATENELAAANYLRSLAYVDANKIGSIGWCFGGGQSLNMALNDPKLAAAVIYYGQPIADTKELARIKAKLLGIYGECDRGIPMSRINEFVEAVGVAKVRHEFYTYPGAPHAFANPSRGQDYRPKEADEAWQKTIEFLDNTLQLNNNKQRK